MRTSVVEAARVLKEGIDPKRFYGHDRVRLAPGVTFCGSALVDDVGGRTVPVVGVGRALALAFSAEEPPALADLVAVMAARYHLPEGDVLEDAVRFLSELDERGLVQIEEASELSIGLRDAVATRGVSLLSLDLLHIARGGRSRRYPATLRGLTGAVFRTQGIIAVLGVLFSAGVALAIAMSLGGDRLVDAGTLRVLIASPFVIGAVHVSLLWFHEAGHMLAASLVGSPCLYVSTRGRKIGIVRRGTIRAGELMISVAGPVLAAIVAGLAAALMGAVLGRGGGVTDATALAQMCLGFFGVGHLVSLTPLGADGSHVLAALRLGRTHR